MVANPKERLTYEDYVAFTERLENEQRIFELIDGEIVEKIPSFTPSEIAAYFIRKLGNYLDVNPIGRLTTPDGGYRMPNGDVTIPDVGFITKARLPHRPEREAPVPPDLAIEVKSPTDRVRPLRRKAEKYLEGGTRLVWLVFPEERKIEVYDLTAEDVFTIDIEGTLQGGDVLPGFTLKVADIFKSLDD
ncbi:MAG: Uma2 family endonuclease [Anaerolineae bacterium]|nr:Uma2 family endonuclease [Anaerolineae bacterium]